MQTSPLTPTAYTSEAVWRAETASIFSQCWVFVGLRSELKGLSHRGVRVGPYALVIQIDQQQQPRAYLNSCSHRHAALCETGLHQGAVRCPYHGWVYDREGVPVGIPSKEAFPLVSANPQAYRLREFDCAAAGEFIFVRIAAHGQSLADYLGHEYEFLTRASQGMDQQEDEFVTDVGANWKVVIENALEGYHVPAVHQRTFMLQDGMSGVPDAPKFSFDDPLHSHLWHAANPDWVRRFARIEKQLGSWPWRFESYTHHHIFPNLTVTSFMGYSFHIQRFHPTAVDNTTVHSRTVGVQFEQQSLTGRKMKEKIYQDGHDFTHKVFEEDRGICLRVQAGLANATRRAVLGDKLEDRVWHFQKEYDRLFRQLNPQPEGLYETP